MHAYTRKYVVYLYTHVNFGERERERDIYIYRYLYIFTQMYSRYARTNARVFVVCVTSRCMSVYVVVYKMCVYKCTHTCNRMHGIRFHIIPCRTMPYHIISCHIISYHNMSYHIISYHIISYHIISYHIISHHSISSHILPYHITSHHITPVCVRVHIQVSAYSMYIHMRAGQKPTRVKFRWCHNT